MSDVEKITYWLGRIAALAVAFLIAKIVGPGWAILIVLGAAATLCAGFVLRRKV